jgi:hypothetical protein
MHDVTVSRNSSSSNLKYVLGVALAEFRGVAETVVITVKWRESSSRSMRIVLTRDMGARFQSAFLARGRQEGCTHGQ